MSSNTELRFQPKYLRRGYNNEWDGTAEKCTCEADEENLIYPKESRRYYNNDQKKVFILTKNGRLPSELQGLVQSLNNMRNDNRAVNLVVLLDWVTKGQTEVRFEINSIDLDYLLRVGDGALDLIPPNSILFIDYDLYSIVQKTANDHIKERIAPIGRARPGVVFGLMPINEGRLVNDPVFSQRSSIDYRIPPRKMRTIHDILIWLEKERGVRIITTPKFNKWVGFKEYLKDFQDEKKSEADDVVKIIPYTKSKTFKADEFNTANQIDEYYPKKEAFLAALDEFVNDEKLGEEIIIKLGNSSNSAGVLQISKHQVK